MTGIICIDKGKDITSFKAVAKVRGITGEKKVGHTGTLDPMATGVLPVMLGGATKFLDYLPDSDKGYRAVFKLGITTDTLDITGNVICKMPVTAGAKDVEAALEKFRGEIMQIPPMYSAKSVNGKRLYELARQGQVIEREPCAVNIKSLTLADYSDDSYTIDVLCSKGTYIRSLIDDIGKELGCGAVMTDLARTGAMGFTLEDCVTTDELQRLRDDGVGFDLAVIPLEKIYKSYPCVVVTPAQAKRFSNGGGLDIKRIKNPPEKDSVCRVYSAERVFLGLGKSDGQELKVLRLLTRRD